jgi:hypothetical protein
MTDKQISDLYKTKLVISELESLQSSYYDSAISELKIKSSMEHWVFDWIYNSSEGQLENYLSKYNIKIEELFHE